MTNSHLLKFYLLGILLQLSLQVNLACAQNLDAVAYVGFYTQRDVDSQAQLFVLDDNTFCFTFTGGALDLVKAGRWETTTPEGMLYLQEIRAETTLYPVIVKNVDRVGQKLVGFNFDGYSLSNAASPVFAMSKTDTLPATFRPIFPQEVDSWSGTYALPLLPTEQANYFFIGDLEVDTGGRPGKKLRIAQYKLEGFDAVRIGFDREQSEPLLQMKAKLVEGVLYSRRDKLGAKRPMPAEMVDAVRAQCIEPILHPQKKAGKKDQEPLPENAQFLTPIKTFELDARVITGEPLFKDKSTDVTTATDSLEEMIGTEREQLKTAFERAFQDSKHADEYLQLTQNLSEKKSRFKIYMPLLGEQFAKILVKTNVDRNIDLAKKYFYHFAENIYPASIGMRNKQLAYNVSVVASQGLVLYGVLKDETISNIVFEKLLGKQFDIQTHDNRTLVYNLACFYALTKNKHDMLIAIAQARKRETPTAQFMQDSDFGYYLQDPDFLRAVK